MRIVVVPTRQFREFLRLWRLVALSERIKEHPLAWRAMRAQTLCAPCHVVADVERLAQFTRAIVDLLYVST
jgi:hypothetical protein